MGLAVAGSPLKALSWWTPRLKVWAYIPWRPSAPRATHHHRATPSPSPGHSSPSPWACSGGLLALCDATVLMCQIRDGLQLSGTLAFSKGSVSLCMDTAEPVGGGSEPGARRICVGLRRKLQLYRWEGGEYALYHSLELPHTPVSLTWRADSIVVGFKKASGYAIVRVEPHAGAEAPALSLAAAQVSLLPITTPRASLVILPPLASPPPDDDDAAVADGIASGDPASGMSDPMVILSGTDGVGWFVSSHGAVLPRASLAWGRAAIAAAFGGGLLPRPASGLHPGGAGCREM